MQFFSFTNISLNSLNTIIPVPTIYGYNLDYNNIIGFPFLIIDYIPRIIAVDLAEALYNNDPALYNNDIYRYGNVPEMYEKKFFRQIASIMVQLASLRLPKIGSIIKDPLKPGHFTAGPLPGTGSSPYTSAAEFNHYYPQSIVQHCYRAEEDLGQEAFVNEFRKLALTFRSSDEESFGVIHGDFGTHNVIVDSEFNILSVIDWGGTKSVPDVYLHMIPAGLGIGIGFAGETDTSECPISPQTRQFASIMEQLRRKQRDQCHLDKFGFVSKEGIAYDLLEKFTGKDVTFNEIGAPTLKWLGEHDTADLARYYHL